MNFLKYTLDVPATATTGNAQTCAYLVDKWVQFKGIAGGAVFAIEGTIDGTNYATLVSAINADGVYEVAAAVTAIRLNRTTLGSGTYTVTLAGR